MKLKEILKISSAPVVIASLCCLTPVVLVLFGIGSITVASSLADTLYGDFKWYFRGVGLITMVIALFYYFYRSKGICTLDEARRRRNEIVNFSAIVVTACVAGYFFFLYVVVHYAGVFLHLWS